jgi:hypothetical protein
MRGTPVRIGILLNFGEVEISHWIQVSWGWPEFSYRSSFDIKVVIPLDEQLESYAELNGCAGVLEEVSTPINTDGFDLKNSDGTFFGKVRRTNEVVANTWHKTLCDQDDNWRKDPLLPAIKSLVDWLLLQDLTEVWSPTHT